MSISDSLKSKCDELETSFFTNIDRKLARWKVMKQLVNDDIILAKIYFNELTNEDDIHFLKMIIDYYVDFNYKRLEIAIIYLDDIWSSEEIEAIKLAILNIKKND